MAIKKITSVLLIVLLSVFSLSAVYAADDDNTIDSTVQAQTHSQLELPDIVDADEAEENGYASRLKQDERDLNTFVFANSDGSQTMRVYSHPVKYIDSDGEIKDISLDIKANSNGTFETKENSIKTVFGKTASDGITLESNGLKIQMIPSAGGSGTLSADSKTICYRVSPKTAYEYSLTYTGFKEDIVVKEYTGQTEYEFTLLTNGLTLVREGHSFVLKDSSGNIKATLGDIIIFTADQRNNTLGELTFETLKENDKYKLTIHVDKHFLQDEKTVYPIRIDPTVEFTTPEIGTIQDVTVYTGTSYYAGTSGTLFIGKSNECIYRSLLKLPDFEMPIIFPEMIKSASLELRDLMCQSTPVDMECRYFTGSETAWSESTTTTWSSIGGDTYVGGLLDTKTVSYGNGDVELHRYSFDITSAVKQWVNGTLSPGKGFVIKASSATENSNGSDLLKYMGSYNRSADKPSIKIVYYTSMACNISTTDSYFLVAATTGSNTIRAEVVYTPQYDGESMWSIAYSSYHDAYQIISMGIKEYYGTRQACIYSNSYGVGTGDDYMLTTATLFYITRNQSGKYSFQSYVTGKYLTCNSISNPILTHTNETDSYRTEFNITGFELDSFNNFFDGSYATGIYDGVAHVKVEVCSDVLQSSLYGSNDYSAALLWNGISNNVVIYGPDDTVPTGTTPFTVSFKLYNFRLDYPLWPELGDYVYGESCPKNANGENCENDDNWHHSEILLNSSPECSLSKVTNASQRNSLLDKIICHEMGHSLKLAHPVGASSRAHEFYGGREAYPYSENAEKCVVYSVMNQDDIYTTNLTAAIPQEHDIINFISKWEYHSTCNH